MFGQRFESAQLHLNGQPRFFEGLSVFYFAETLAGIEYQAKGFIQTGGLTIFLSKNIFSGNIEPINFLFASIERPENASTL